MRVLYKLGRNRKENFRLREGEKKILQKKRHSQRATWHPKNENQIYIISRVIGYY